MRNWALKAGDHILEIGPGWGLVRICLSARRQVHCITISPASIDYLKSRAKALGYDWEVINVDLLEYRNNRRYDAIVSMGVIEYLVLHDFLKALAQTPLVPQSLGIRRS